MHLLRASRHLAFNCVLTSVLSGLVLASAAHAGQDFSTGVSDDRVSLPEGPGSLEGVGENVSIDANMATMRWSVPVDVPEGFDGAQPALALAYSSGSGSSVAGIGWTFDAPYIERMTSRGLPEYDETDLFSANGGDELVRITADDASASTPAVYRSRFEKEFIRYSWINRSGGANGYWKAEYGDGSVGYFGATSAGVSVASARVAGDEGTFRYHLVDKVDTEGHVLHYTWIKDGATSLLSSAEYVFGAGGVARYSVGVEYEDREDHQSDCKAGFEDVVSQRIKHINVFSQGQRIRRYVLSYDDYDDAGGQSRLARVETRGLNNELYPIVQSFEYSRSLGVSCEATSCGKPTLVSMGAIGANLRAGRATLIDMNGDGLPDIVDTTAVAGGNHRFFFNQLAASGTQSFSAAVTSAVGTAAGHALGTRPVQVIDQDGDGFTDIVNGLTGQVLFNRGLGDWAGTRALGNDNFPSNAEDNELRFIDIDNDKRIDAIRSENNTTTVLRSNESGGFDPFVSEAIGFSFSGQNIQLTDMNGDGLLDVVRTSPDTLSYKLSYGRGKWGPLVEIAVPMSDVEDDLATLEDMNGDGLSDLLIVSGTRVKYMLNRNGVAFADPVLVENAIGGSIPERTGDTLVLTADMNGNGSTDILWVQQNGNITYLDVFPVRQHLMTKIENGIGRVTDISYTTSVLEAAAAREAGNAWAYQVPFPMTVVKSVDEHDLLTNVHDVGDYVYFDGFYDGIERTYRGYELVELHQEGDEHQEGSVTTTLYDVGTTDAHRAGLKLQQDLNGEDREIQSQSWRYEECAIAEVPTPAALIALGRKPIRRFCETSTETVVKEGLPADRWLTISSTTRQDGYGNTIEMAELGVTDVTGDERYRSWTFIDPTTTDGLWMIGAVVRETMTGQAGPAIGTERVTYYDGAPFVGLPAGQLTLGHQTRVAERLNEDTFEDVTRQRNNDDGQVVELYDALGVIGQHGNRSTWTYDADGVLVTETAMHLNDAEGQPYSLVRRYSHEPAFDKPVQATAWIRVVDGEDRSPRNDMFFSYDGFGRLVSRVRPGDSADAPTEVFVYELGSPTTRVVTKRRSTTEAFDLEQVSCMDGRGRTFQKRSRVKDGEWHVDGFTVFNLRGEKLRVSQPYSGTSGACDVAPPAGVAAVTYRFDAVNRTTRVEQVDGSVYETYFEPLAEFVRDPGDLDETSSSFDTPLVMYRDGLERITRLERRRAGGAAPAVFTLKYDSELNLAGYIDPAGHEKTQTFDLRGRIIGVDDPNSGRQSFGYDAAGNMNRRVNGDGVVLRAAFDGANRLVERWNESDRECSLVRAIYDVGGTCAAADCSNVAGKLSGFVWPGGGERLGYDGRGNPLFTSREIEGINYVTRTAWDHADRPTAVTYPDGRVIETELDGMDRPIAIPGVVDSIAYDDRGQLERFVYANGVATDRAYDPRMRLSSIKAATPGDDLFDIDIAYDGVGNVQRTVDNIDTAGFSLDAVNSYDEWHRLVATAFADDETESFTYDIIDNLLSSKSTKAASTAALGDFQYEGFGPSAVSKIGNRAYEYDDAGQLTKRGETELTWDHMGRMTSSREGGVETGRFIYGQAAGRVAKIEKSGVVHYVSDDFEVRDGIGVLYVRVGAVRIARLESKAISLTTLADVAPIDDLDGELNAGDAWVAHAAGAGLVDTTVPDDADAGRLLLAAARRLLHDEGPKTAYLHRDNLGSAVLATDDAGEVIGRQTFHAFGEPRATSGFVDAYTFTGQETDESTGLTHFKHRYLDASAGRWISPDPLFQLTTEKATAQYDEMSTAYGYASNNPTSNIDPDGLSVVRTAVAVAVAPIRLAAAIVGAVVGAVVRGAIGLVKGGISIAKSAQAKVGAFAKKYPRVATAIRVGLMVTGAALAVAAAVATGGVAGAFIIALTVASTAYKVKAIATDYSDLKQTRDPIKRDKAAKRMASGMFFEAVGVASGGMTAGGVLAAATAAGTALTMLGTELASRAEKVFFPD